ncbi:MAG: TIGR02646 family protein [Gammaproteobacteria bacterium]|nr:TIGR02646 family protein [Gammaproteobacteria bacterium]MYB38343.1 TIGR02646 family protein [Gammaproteobacteria bacterium]
METPTPGLAAYKEQELGSATWEGFGSHDGSSDAKRELMAALEELQHGLCGYCESAFPSQGRQLEHVVARSDTERNGPERALDHTNIIACCGGGQRSSSTDGGIGRRRSGGQGHLSCGQRKGENADADFLDPRELPSSPSLMRVRSDGEIVPDEDACAEAAIETARVAKTIRILGLNVARLREARRVQRGLALDDHDGCSGDTGRIRATAQSWLLLDRGGRLPAFFTTVRGVFGRTGEQILAAPGQPWT